MTNSILSPFGSAMNRRHVLPGFGLRRVHRLHTADNLVLFRLLNGTVEISACAVAQRQRLARSEPEHTACMVRIFARERIKLTLRSVVDEKILACKLNLSYSNKLSAFWQGNNQQIIPKIIFSR